MAGEPNDDCSHWVVRGFVAVSALLPPGLADLPLRGESAGPSGVGVKWFASHASGGLQFAVNLICDEVRQTKGDESSF